MTRLHFIWDRTERAFTRGQRLMRKRRFAEALRCFELAGSTDPQYPQIHLYRGLALSEMGNYQDATTACEEAIRLDPSNGALRMFLAVIHLDHKRPEIALNMLDRVAAEDSKNQVAKGYRLLAKYDLKDDGALKELQGIIRHVSDGVGARLVQRLMERFPEKMDEEADIKPTPTLADSLPQGLKSRFEKHRKARTSQKLTHAQSLIRAGRHQKALRILESMPSETSKSQAAFDKLKRAALEGVWSDLRKDLREHEAKKTRVPSGDRSATPDQKFERRRRFLLRRLATSLIDGLKSEEGDQFLNKWWLSYSSCGKPKGEEQIATRVISEMATLNFDRKNWAKVVDLCEEAKNMGCDVRTNMMEAQAELALGHRNAARWLLEEYLSADLHYAEIRLEKVLMALPPG